MRELALFAGAGGGILGGNSLDGAPSALLNMLPTLAECCSRGSAMDTCRGSLSGMTCEPSTATLAGRGRCCQRRVPLHRHQQQRTQARVCRRTERTMARHGPHHWRSSTRFVFVENVAALLVRGMGDVLGDLAALGFDARWDVLGTADFGGRSQESECGSWPTLKASDAQQFSRNFAYFERRVKVAPDLPVMVGPQDAANEGRFLWPPESGLDRVADGVADRGGPHQSHWKRPRSKSGGERMAAAVREPSNVRGNAHLTAAQEVEDGRE